MFQRATRADPQAFAGFLNLAICSLAEQRAAEALVPAQRAVELAPKLAASHFTHGRVLSALGRHEAALGAFERASRFDPGDGLIDVARAETCVQLSRLKEALSLYDAAIAKKPDFLPAHISRGMVGLRLGRADVARSAAQAARAIDPDHPWLRELERQIGGGS